MPSLRLNLLNGRIAELRRCLLPETFAIPGTYEDESLIKVRALSFRVLAHAEIENFFEDRVIEIAKAALASWKSSRFVSRSLLCLLGFSGQEMERPPPTLAAPDDQKRKHWPMSVDVTHRASKSVSVFVQYVSQDNHGIREKNVLAMLLPVGISHSEIDAVVLADIDEFGRRRGEAAHQSSATHIQTGVDPKEEFERVHKLLIGITSIDIQLDGLLANTSGRHMMQGAEVEDKKSFTSDVPETSRSESYEGGDSLQLEQEDFEA